MDNYKSYFTLSHFLWHQSGLNEDNKTINFEETKQKETNNKLAKKIGGRENSCEKGENEINKVSVTKKRPKRDEFTIKKIKENYRQMKIN